MSKPGGASPASTQFDKGSGGGELGCLYKAPRAFPNPPVTVRRSLMPGGQRDATPPACLQLIQPLPASSSGRWPRETKIVGLCNPTTPAVTVSVVAATQVSLIIRSGVICASYAPMGVSNANRSAALNDRNTINRNLFRAEHRATSRKDSHRHAIQTDSSQASETEEGKEPKADKDKAPSSTRTGLCSGL